MRYKNNIEAVANLQPDYLGFIFYDKSTRYFEGPIPKLPKTIKKTGVFVDASASQVLHQIMAHSLNAIQLHGKESPGYCKALKEAILETQISKNEFIPYKFEIIKVFSIKDEFDFSVLNDYEEVCDYYLFDTKGKLPGGNGYTFNWDVLKNYPSTKPYFLSGGIGLDETEKIKKFKESPASKYCYAIDVNSRFEIEAGLKNIESIEQFKDSIITNVKS